jgi:hypothetical protein
MMNLTDTSTLIRIVTSAVGQISGVWSGVKATTTPAYTPIGDQITDITTATTTTLVAAPTGTDIFNVKHIEVANESTTVTNVVTIEQYDGTNTGRLWKGSLAPGEFVVIDELGVPHYFGSDGAEKINTGSGQFIGETLLTVSGNFTTGPNTKKIRIRGVGGGGGGAGCTSVASAASAGGGGGAGGYAEKIFDVSPNTAYAFTIGALGAGASGALGGTGGDSTFVVGATTVTAKGGVGAPVATAVNALTVYRGGIGGAVSTNGDVNGGGDNGGNGVIVVVATPVGASGAGGSSPFGGGGGPLSAAGNGNNATGFGAGGSGAMTGASAVRTGGSGTAGCWVVEEFT